MGKKCSMCGSGLGFLGLGNHGTGTEPLCVNCSQKSKTTKQPSQVSTLNIEKNNAPQQKIDESSKRVQNNQLLIKAVRDKNIEQCNEQLKNGHANVNAIMGDGYTLLNYCVREGGSYEEIAKVLIQNGADVKSLDKYGCTPLYSAANWFSAQTLKMMIDAGADINAKTNDNVTPFYAVLRQGSLDAVKMMLEYSPDVSMHIKERPWIFLIFRDNNAESLFILDVLHQLHVNVNAKKEDGRSIMHRAIECEPVLVLKLIEYGADLNAVDNFGETPLGLARKQGRKVIVDLLISKNASESKQISTLDGVWDEIKNDKDALIQKLLEILKEAIPSKFANKADWDRHGEYQDICKIGMQLHKVIGEGYNRYTNEAYERLRSYSYIDATYTEFLERIWEQNGIG